MNNLSAILTSSVGRKILNGLTGMLLCIYILVHMAANTLIICNPTAFNLYAHFLMGLGPLLIVIEIMLVAVFVVHALSAITVWWSKSKIESFCLYLIKSPLFLYYFIDLWIIC